MLPFFSLTSPIINKIPMEAIIRFIFVLVLVYYAFKLTIRYVLPWILTRFVKKQQEKYDDMNTNYTSGDGEVHVKTKTTNKAKHESDFGEYVDFEEIDD